MSNYKRVSGQRNGIKHIKVLQQNNDQNFKIHLLF